MNEKVNELCLTIMEHVKIAQYRYITAINYARSGDFLNANKYIEIGDTEYQKCILPDAELNTMVEDGVLRDNPLIISLVREHMNLATVYNEESHNLLNAYSRISTLEGKVQNHEARITALEERL